ncbi:UNVERIFIED_CONTAM: hypothetical protein ABID98_005909 [Brevibacillus sp. OAP136]
MKPDLRQLLMVAERLENSGIVYTLGGSGLLYRLGLTQTVRDWDLMTDAPKEAVMAALGSLPVEEITSGDYPYASQYKLLIHHEAPQVELISRFAIYSEVGLCTLPLTADMSWQGVRVSSPEVWFVAYALMNRTEKAGLLLDYLRVYGVRHDVMRKLLAEPLPDDIVQVLQELMSLSPFDKNHRADEASSTNR